MKTDDRFSSYMELLNSEAAEPTSEPGRAPETDAASGGHLVDAYARAESDEARRERLTAIQRQLAAGSYNISGKDVAEKIIKILAS